MFDTHCHLNFSRFRRNLSEVIQRAKDAGVSHIVVPGTGVESSKKAVEIAETYDNVYAAVGIHPHHVFDMMKTLNSKSETLKSIQEIENLLVHPKVMAIGEVGVDRHVYEETKYETYNVEKSFIDLQKELLKEQIKLAIRYKKSLVLHNREAIGDLLSVISSQWDTNLEGRTVFHCCEPNEKLLEFAKKHKVFIGVDGDITYDLLQSMKKKEFIKKVPLEMLVLETDSPFLLPEPLRTKKEYPNEPKNILLIAKYVAEFKGIRVEDLTRQTTENGKRLFGL